jgi:hypothetical protein
MKERERDSTVFLRVRAEHKKISGLKGLIKRTRFYFKINNTLKGRETYIGEGFNINSFH